MECGMELKGTEVKSMRQGRMNLKESFAIVKDGEVLVCGMHISPYEQGNIFNTDPMRQKKLLLHKSQIRHLAQEVGKMGYSLIPASGLFEGRSIQNGAWSLQGQKAA